jgi:arsenate reductase (glutaredoxin)
MSKIIVYQKPTCTTSRKVVKLLDEKGVSFEKVNYYETPFTKTKLNDLLKKMKMKPSDLLRKKDKIYKELEFKNKNYTETQILSLLIKHPDLIERPIVQKGTKVILARPPESVNEILK